MVSIVLFHFHLFQELENVLCDKESLQQELERTKELLAVQRQEYDSLQARHQADLAQLREAGNSALALVVEEYKVNLLVLYKCLVHIVLRLQKLCAVAVLEQQQKSEEILQQAMKQEAEKWQQSSQEMVRGSL
jgi:hypothetical protein